MTELEEARYLANELDKLDEGIGQSIINGAKNVASKVGKTIVNNLKQGFGINTNQSSSQTAMGNANESANKKGNDAVNNSLMAAAKFINKNAKIIFTA